MAPSPSDSAPGRAGAADKSLTAAEAEIEATRERLAQTIDELLERSSPKNVVRRQVADVKAYFVDPQGNPRTEHILMVVGGVAGLVGVVVMIRKVTR